MSSALDAALRQASSLEELEHRPWPVPDAPWRLGQTWNELAFLHWRVPVSALEPHVPKGLSIDIFDGSAWLGITLFRLTDLRVRGLPPLPRVSSFLELNVRTYVTADDRPGIWFFSLDAGSRLAATAARSTYRLPYFHARMELRHAAGWIAYECARVGEPARTFSGRYRAAGEAAEPRPSTLEHFLTERYCLYAAGSDRLWRAEIHHRPWPLQPAEAELELNTISPVALPAEPPLCHFAGRQDVVIWPLERIS